jgi:septum site-determining protein MinC
MSEQTVAIKGVKDGLLVTVSETEDWQIIVKDLAARIDHQSSFFNGARITLDVGSRPVRKDELSSLKAMLERRNISLWSLMSDSATSIEAASALDLRTALITASANPDNPDAVAFNPEEDGTIGVMIRRTLRSGRTVHSNGHVVVYGDVNPGAEIIAMGDVIVWGRLRGNVHAGSDGDESAVICALDMTPTQIRIAGYISIPPKDKRHKPKPEIASIRDRQIVVVTWG